MSERPDAETRSGGPVADRLDGVAQVRRRLRGSASVADLFARAAHATSRHCGFDRAVVVTVAGGVLSTADSGAIADAAGDRLRRELLARPLLLERDTLEHEVVRRGLGHPGAGQGSPSRLSDALGLGHYAFAAVVPETHTLALLVADRRLRPVDADDLAVLEVVAGFVALELAHVVQRARVADLVAEVRQFSTTSLALARETSEAPVALPRDRGLGPTFPIADGAGVPSGATARALFSERELRVAELLAEGRSNREIAASLIISPETVKKHVARILRKLGAANRAEAVSLFLRLEGGSS